MNIEELVKKVFIDRGVEARDYSIRNIIGEYITPIKPHVTAIGTSGGKTWTTAARFEFLYKYGYLKSDEKVLILAADKSILRGNFADSFGEFFKDIPASFTWRAVKDKRELKKAIEDDIQVIITLPQTIQKPKNLELLSKLNFKWMVQDEAHKWYFKKTIQRIIKTIKPDYQSLLTGTPFKFNMRAKDFLIDYTSVREMYERGFLSDFTTQVLHSDVTLSKLDYVSMLGNLKRAKRLTDDELTKSFDEVITQIIKKLKIPFKGLSTTHNITNNMASVFGKLQKTIIFTHGIPEADCLGEYLNRKNVGVLVTHSKTGVDSTEVFNDFKEKDEFKVLVAVNQGKEGFDFPELYNVIDMTYSQNFEVVMQIIGRILRKSKNITNKYFFKVAPKNTSGYFVDWMNALFMLFDEEWYSQFNGKNGFDIQIPSALIGGSSGNGKGNGNGNGSGRGKGNFKPKKLDFFNSLQFMEDNKWFKMNHKLSTVATTTLNEICVRHGLKKETHNFTNEELKELSLKFNTRVDFKRYNNAAYRQVLGRKLDSEYFAHMGDKLNKKINVSDKESIIAYVNKMGFSKLSDVLPNRVRKMIYSYNLVETLFPESKVLNSYTNEELEDIVKQFKSYKDFYESEYHQICRYRGLVDEYKTKYFTLGKFDKTRWNGVDIDDVISFCKKYDKPYHMEKDTKIYTFNGIETRAKPILRIAKKNNVFDTIWPNR
jgi:superfamily II DNA or RNA helicase